MTDKTTKPKKTSTINWNAVKTNIIIALVFGIIGLIGGYFYSINLHAEARASVMQDIKAVSKTSE